MNLVLTDKLRENLCTVVNQKKEKLTQHVKNMVTEDGQLKSLAEIKKHVAKLQEQNKFLITKVDDLEQYSRRECVRIYGVTTERNETSDKVKNKVIAMIQGAGMNIPESSIYRAHRTQDRQS